MKKLKKKKNEGSVYPSKVLNGAFGHRCAFAFVFFLHHPHLQGGDSQRCLGDNKVLRTHRYDGDIIYDDEVRLRRGVLQIYTFVTSIDVRETLLLIAFLCNSPCFHSLNPSFISFLFLSCTVFIPLFSSAPHSHIPSLFSQLLLYLTNIAETPLYYIIYRKQ